MIVHIVLRKDLWRVIDDYGDLVEFFGFALYIDARAFVLRQWGWVLGETQS